MVNEIVHLQSIYHTNIGFFSSVRKLLYLKKEVHKSEVHKFIHVYLSNTIDLLETNCVNEQNYKVSFLKVTVTRIVKKLLLRIPHGVLQVASFPLFMLLPLNMGSPPQQHS